LARPFDFVKEEMVLGEMGGPRRGRTVRYRRFVEAGLLREIASPLEAVQWQTVLGSESFARRVQDWMSELRQGRQEVTALRRGTRVLSPHAVLQSSRM
jgi:hypothetical protein